MTGFAVVIGSFHRKEGEAMLETVREGARERGLTIVAEVWVPGSMEKPLALKRLLLREDIEGAVVLGIIERGETAHGLVMAQSALKAIIDLQLEFMKPVGVGILGPDIHPSQIPPRVTPYARAAFDAMAVMLQPQ
ncbi:6,7-dimethyl-8-ribityllumazine synthase [Rhodospirillum sp. A1_3_36]|uniref:6,7-dimethyl-8-ribityllumazine synthase n=1 Tax=Rhodospirillum sp. A1_3_36 TaxID=3391666 RepID=UPI0039A75A57